MSTWIGVTVLAWIVVSAVVSIAIGGMIRLADSRRPAEGNDVRYLPTRGPRPQPVEGLRRVS